MSRPTALPRACTRQGPIRPRRPDDKKARGCRAPRAASECHPILLERLQPYIGRLCYPRPATPAKLAQRRTSELTFCPVPGRLFNPYERDRRRLHPCCALSGGKMACGAGSRSPFLLLARGFPPSDLRLTSSPYRGCPTAACQQRRLRDIKDSNIANVSWKTPTRRGMVSSLK